MATLTNVELNHFDGHRNLTQAQKAESGPTLAELIRAAYADIVAVEAVTQGMRDPKDSVRLVTVGALAAYTATGAGSTKLLTADANGALSVDGVAVAEGDRILVNNDGTVTAADRGIYVVDDPGAAGAPYILSRATDANESAEVTAMMFVPVSEGSTKAESFWYLDTADDITLDTTALSFTEFHPGTHADLHVQGGADEVDGDQLDLDLTLTHITADTTPAEVTDAAHLGAIVKGVDNQLGLMRTAPTMTAGAEAADVIAVTFDSPVEAVQQYMIEAIPSTTMEPATSLFTMAENGVGAEVSPTARARLIFTTDASGDATIDVTDVGGASGETVYLRVTPLFDQAAVAQQVAPAVLAITFD
jgi:hypothetical protein